MTRRSVRATTFRATLLAISIAWGSVGGAWSQDANSEEEAGNPLLTFQAGGGESGAMEPDVSPGVEIELRQIRSRIQTLESRVDALVERMAALSTEIKAASDPESKQTKSGRGGKDGIDGKISSLEKEFKELKTKYMDHSHEVLSETRTRAGTIENLDQGKVGRSGSIPTGRTTIGKPR